MKKIISLLLAILMISSMFVACNDNSTNIDSTESSKEDVLTTDAESTSKTTENNTSDTTSETTSDTESSSESTDTEAPEEKIYTIAENKTTDYTIVIPDSNSQEFTDAANDLRAAFLEDYNVKITLYKESIFKTIHEGSMDAPKIVLNAIENDSVSKEIQGELNYNSFRIQMLDGTLYIIGGTAEATILAIDYFIKEFMILHPNAMKLSDGLIYETDVAFPLGNLTIDGNHISKYSIVYYDSYYAKIAAQDIQIALWDFIGIKLPLVSDAESESDYEILVGKTNRDESKSVRAAYSRPNVNYDVTAVNGKLVIMAEGFSTLEIIDQKFINYVSKLKDGHNISGNVITGDIMETDNADNVYEGNMLTFAADTDVRVMAWNMGGPGTWGQLDLAEKLADTILKNLPDVLGTNEFYDPAAGNYRITFDRVMKEISEYYYEIESDNDFPSDERIPSFTKNRGPRPQKIFVRKASGIKVIAAGWRYTDYQKDVDYRSFPWAVLETKDGDKFIYTVSHYTNMSNDNVAAIEQLETVAHAQAQSGSSETLPTILSGDLWTSRGKGAYKYFTDAGYKDAQRTAKVNDNNNISHSTFHDYGKLQPTGRAITDLIFYSAGMTPLKFKVITSLEAIDSSDHSPLVCDFKFS